MEMIELESLFDDVDFGCEISRSNFERICASLFREVLGPIKSALEIGGLEKSAIHDILMVGGSTQIPMLQETIRDFFDGKEPIRLQYKHLEGAVVYGAAVRAAVCSDPGQLQVPPASLSEFLLIQACSQSFRLAVAEGGDRLHYEPNAADLTRSLIAPGTTLPHYKTIKLTTVVDYQPGVLIEVFEDDRNSESSWQSERRMPIGSLWLGIPLAHRGEVDILVYFDSNGRGTYSLWADIDDDLRLKERDCRAVQLCPASAPPQRFLWTPRNHRHFSAEHRVLAHRLLALKWEIPRNNGGENMHIPQHIILNYVLPLLLHQPTMMKFNKDAIAPKIPLQKVFECKCAPYAP